MAPEILINVSPLKSHGSCNPEPPCRLFHRVSASLKFMKVSVTDAVFVLR